MICSPYRIQLLRLCLQLYSGDMGGVWRMADCVLTALWCVCEAHCSIRKIANCWLGWVRNCQETVCQAFQALNYTRPLGWPDVPTSASVRPGKFQFRTLIPMLVATNTDNQSISTDVNYAEVRVWETVACDTYNGRSGGERSLAVHNVFSQAIPGAFGVSFLRRLIGLSQNLQATKSEAVN